LEGGYFVLRRSLPAIAARDVLMTNLPDLLTFLRWPKSMRWGQSGEFTWVRPLRRIVCLLDDEIIPFKLGPITASNETQGHRFLAPGAFTVSSAADWEDKLKQRYVIADQTKRREMVADGISEKAQSLGLQVVGDPELIDEVNGLVEWPVPLVGRIEKDFMDLPPEVRELSMKVNQRYFALRDADGKPAPYFAFIANIEAEDAGSAIIGGNERVLRARLSDARHFWKLDTQHSLDYFMFKLKKIVFHAKLGTQFDRAQRIAERAIEIGQFLGADDEELEQIEWAAKLSKADLATGMVGEFPELQGTIGAYYAEKHPHGWDGKVVGQAIRTHYQPRGQRDTVPSGTVAISVSLADKLDTLYQFFEIGEKPTGSGDPYALRRAALGVIRIILENNLIQFPLNIVSLNNDELLEFILDRLRVMLKSDGRRYDILEAAFASARRANLVLLMKRVDALESFLSTTDGLNLLSAYKRTANILDDAKDVETPLKRPDPSFFLDVSERELFAELTELYPAIVDDVASTDFTAALKRSSKLRTLIDNFFESVKVNVDDPDLRLNRLRLLASFRDTVRYIADFSKIEG
jgi:glycyl-tRNA synthetase beta chain